MSVPGHASRVAFGRRVLPLQERRLPIGIDLEGTGGYSDVILSASAQTWAHHDRLPQWAGSAVPEKLQALLHAMTAPRPGERPDMSQAVVELAKVLEDNRVTRSGSLGGLP